MFCSASEGTRPRTHLNWLTCSHTPGYSPVAQRTPRCCGARTSTSCRMALNGAAGRTPRPAGGLRSCSSGPSGTHPTSLRCSSLRQPCFPPYAERCRSCVWTSWWSRCRPHAERHACLRQPGIRVHGTRMTCILAPKAALSRSNPLREIRIRRQAGRIGCRGGLRLHARGSPRLPGCRRPGLGCRRRHPRLLPADPRPAGGRGQRLAAGSSPPPWLSETAQFAPLRRVAGGRIPPGSLSVRRKRRSVRARRLNPASRCSTVLRRACMGDRKAQPGVL